MQVQEALSNMRWVWARGLDSNIRCVWRGSGSSIIGRWSDPA